MSACPCWASSPGAIIHPVLHWFVWSSWSKLGTLSLSVCGPFSTSHLVLLCPTGIVFVLSAPLWLGLWGGMLISSWHRSISHSLRLCSMETTAWSTLHGVIPFTGVTPHHNSTMWERDCGPLRFWRIKVSFLVYWATGEPQNSSHRYISLESLRWSAWQCHTGESGRLNNITGRERVWLGLGKWTCYLLGNLGSQAFLDFFKLKFRWG